MPCQLPADCINDIFEYLEEDKITLHSCLLVNRLWCEVSVRILWKDIWRFKYTISTSQSSHRLDVSLQILHTLITCLPNESKDLLLKYGISIPTLNSKTPLFNYPSFCKVLSIREVCQITNDVLKSQNFTTSLSLKDGNHLVSQEIVKMFINQISSLKKLTYYSNIYKMINFTSFPGARDCLTDISELICISNINSEFFHQLSQICCNIQSLTIKIESIISSRLKDLISSQNGLKYLSLILTYDSIDWSEIIPSLTKHSNSLIKLKISGGKNYVLLSFISIFNNLRELVLSFKFRKYFQDFNELQNISFTQLQILKFPYGCPEYDHLIKFLEKNGKNLKELYIGKSEYSISLAIAKYCLNLRSLFTPFMDNEIENLKIIFNSCQQLESIKICCGHIHLNEKEFLEVLAKYSPKSFYKLRLVNYSDSKLVPEDLEEFFMNWKNRIPQKSLSFIVIIGYYKNCLEVKKENMKVIEKYKKLGIVKEFGTENLYI